ncbi:hypothetical protein BAUCODRAFT_75477 [Baudoinia panamericana UAMH 10762]|uniref:Uncharacterized protein n=1 Tax=Baudoinia panamericana (strain UAMH 10762) TaxID=717646 RepID=M2N3G6_BAUPA|nr:uncharacterized protein BAUCODRAFT_75477 [Baudoinia panamericana UAMH 10762]EMC93524.1 hypothetical protein BAUCODRAFT_75477 [Baudoinia panamericana UAMH 10762]
MAVEAEWVNLTGYPALPTGVATIIKANAVKEINGCISPQSLWSCATPPTQQSGQSTIINQPSFRLQIRFRNDTVPGNKTQLVKRSGHAANAQALFRRDIWSDSLYAANPAPPSTQDQSFLGQFTDNVSMPYEGEQTPFSMSLLDAETLVSPVETLGKRQSNPYPYPTPNDSTTVMGASTAASSSIPRPALLPNGKPADSRSYPLVEAQPLRLYDRGKPSEHYGFYTYFDRSLLVSNTSSSTANPFALGAGNVALDNATAVCTWSQTRLHVQMWTRKGGVASLDHPIPLNGLPAVDSTANNMSAPGSFPYPVTVTVDRHGGQANKKGVYCYGLDADHHVMVNADTWMDEDRAYVGRLVNAAQMPGINGTKSAKRDAGSVHDGVDGGNGGCLCQWQNY